MNSNKPVLKIVITQTGITIQRYHAIRHSADRHHAKRHQAKRHQAERYHAKGITLKGITLKGIKRKGITKRGIALKAVNHAKSLQVEILQFYLYLYTWSPSFTRIT